jgi:hypothetical protein
MSIKRLENNPIITSSMLAGNEGCNINGPSLIKVPDWIFNRLGLYYLYFAHHHGKFIRLAYANNLNGPWQIYTPGVLNLTNLSRCYDHIASPDVHVEAENRQIRIYFHSVVKGQTDQKTFIATSDDGLTFDTAPQPIAEFYLRAIPWKKYWIGMSKGGFLYLSNTNGQTFESLPNSAFPVSDRMANAPGDVRHVALNIKNNLLEIYYTKIGDKPESIYKAFINLEIDPKAWNAENPKLLLKPERDWEGANLPLNASSYGAAYQPTNALRDPAIFVDNEKSYLLYAVAGESGIAIAEIQQDESIID